MTEIRKRPSAGAHPTDNLFETASTTGGKGAPEREDSPGVASPAEVAFTLDKEPTPKLKCHLRADQVPAWLHFPYIYSGYRFGGDYWQCAMSLFVSHNELLNAWTMILGAVLSTASLIFIFSRYNVQGADISAFVLFWTSLIAHLPFSVGYHLFLPISMSVYNFWRRLDISFVLLMSVQLTYGMSYFVYPHLWQTLLATGLVAIVSALGIRTVYTFEDGQHLERSKVTRWIGLSALGYYFPIVYQAVLDGNHGVWSVPFVAAFVVPASLVGGAYVYEIHFPERFMPGKLDIVGNSHLWMHFGVISAHLMGFCFVLHNYLRRTGQLST